MSELTRFMSAAQTRVEKALTSRLPSAKQLPFKLHDAMRYAVLAPGKRIRPILVYASGQACGVSQDQLDGLASAVEFVHAYSLIHDDLPAMDDDDLRRGKPTCHVKYDQATAILAGDALQPLAFETICNDPALNVSAATRLKMLRLLAQASGSHGMVGGQALDLDATGHEQSLTELENIHIHKTGALIRTSVVLGALAADNVDDLQLRKLDHYAKCIGLAFQIVDDILDVVADSETLGKTGGKDAQQQKSTYPQLLGLNGAREKAQSLHDDALESLESLDERANPLRQLARFIIERGH